MFDREKAFIEDSARSRGERFPELKIVLEHITTREAAQYVARPGPNVGATITAHHLLYNRNAIFIGGIRPHHYCLPVLKREEHRRALVEAATSRQREVLPRHRQRAACRALKEHACGCAGCYTGTQRARAVREAFDAAGALDRLEGFASFTAPSSTGCRATKRSVTLAREDWTRAADGCRSATPS